MESTLKIFAVRAAAEIERLRASEALQRSEASYRAIFEASEDAIFIHDWDTGAILDVNTKACETYGYSREELRRTSIADTCSGVFPYTAEEALRLMQLAQLGRCPPFEWQRRNKDGSLHWDEVRLKPVMIDGRPHMLAFSRDITVQKQALEDLREREEQYRAIFERSLDGLFMWDENLRVVDVNPAGLAIYGYRREDIIGQTYPRTMPEDYVRERLQMVRWALAGENTHLETTVLRPDGSSFDADLRLMPFVQRGQPHALAVVRDISERRRRERELQRSEARFRATVEAAFDGVVVMDSKGGIVEFNAAAERVFGHRREDVLGRRMADVIIPQRLREAHQRASATSRGNAPVDWWAGWWKPRGCARTAPSFRWRSRSASPPRRRAPCSWATCATSPSAGAPSRRCATARSSTARSSTPRPTRWCCATPISASSTSTPPTRR